MTQTVTALYDTYDSAVSAVNALETSGIPQSDISIVSNNVDNRYDKDRSTNAAEDAGKGAGIGAAVGGVGGLLTGLGLLAIPGVGPVVAAGWLVATAAGAATGAVVGGAAGGLVGSLTGAGVAERDAHFYAEGVRRGGTLVTARVDDARASTAREILQRYKAVDPAIRSTAYRETGWSSFDENAPAYTPEQIAAERARHIGGASDS
jgi:heat induced stress protein YflT